MNDRRRARREARTLGAGNRRLFGGYGPLVALAVGFLLVVSLVPTIAREQIVQRMTVEGSRPSPGVDGGTAAPGRDTTSAPPNTVPGAPGGAASRTGAAPSRTAVPGDRTSGATGPGERAAPALVAGRADPCADRTVQILGDTYSPPCISWNGGDNGGATSRGVSADTIRIGFRLPVENIRDYQSVISQLTGGKSDSIPFPTEADVRRTVAGIVEYFNRNFQFYGRRIELVEWKGQGSIINEIVGAGQEAANADAIRAAKELQVFADVSAFTQPYNDALARQGVVAIGAPYMSREWFRAHAPYSWSIVPDCSIIAEGIAEYANKRVYGSPVQHAGGDLNGKPRKVAILAPDNPEYQQCVDAGAKIIAAAGNRLTRYSYTLDLATLSDQANNLAAKLKNDGITTMVLATDPLLPLLLTSRLSQQSYYPEWMVTGAGLTDLDLVGQFYDQSQWQHAFGISYFAEQQPIGASYAYHAFKSIDPDHEPIFGVELLYYFCYMVAIGVQMAGPNLTPDTFAAGMRAYPGGTGPAGTWAFPDGEYTPYRDAREIWWDPNGTSVLNGAPGRYASNGKRYRPGTWPAGKAGAS